MTALIDRIDPNAHPRVYWSLLVFRKWVYPILKIAAVALLIIGAGTMLTQGLDLFDREAATDNELALFQLWGGSFLLIVAIGFRRRL